MTSEASSYRPAVGAYGLAIRGGGSTYLVEAADAWPELEIVRRAGNPVARRNGDADHVEFPLLGGGVVLIDRSPARATYVTPQPLGDAELAHPYLVPAAAVHSYWLGRETFHAGAFVLADRVWAVVGPKLGGKSTLLAGMAARGLPIVADDLLVVDEAAHTFAGPRLIDLREGTGPLYRAASLGVVGGRERWRVRLPPTPARLPLGGWLFLEWGDGPAATRLDAGERLKAIGAHRSFHAAVTVPRIFLQLAALPAWKLVRPADEDYDPVLDLALDTVSAEA